MRTHRLSSLAGTAAFAAVIGAVALRPAPARARSLGETGDCAVWLVGVLPTGQTRATATMKYSEPIGMIMKGSFPDSAHADVISAKKSPNGEMNSAQLVVNTAQAVEGNWKLTLTGDAGVCTGDIYIGTPTQKKKKG